MSALVKRLVMLLLVGAVAASALDEYREGYCLAEASALVEGVLLGRLRGDVADQAVARAGQRLACAHGAARREPIRFGVVQGLQRMLAGRPADAEALLRQAIAAGERPELVLNLGRALAAQGDEVGARAAFLRAMWAAPQVADTLPRAMRDALAVELQVLEQALRDGRGTVPPLPP